MLKLLKVSMKIIALKMNRSLYTLSFLKLLVSSMNTSFHKQEKIVFEVE